MLGVKTVPIVVETDGRRRTLRIATVVAKSKKLEYRDHDYRWTISERNGFYSPFTYQGP